MIELYSPQNEPELALLRSILDAEGIEYFVANDMFGSMEVGLSIRLFNKKTIMVRDDQFERAKELLSDYMENTREKDKVVRSKYSLFDKVRMVLEFLLFGWVMPGRKRGKS